MENDEEEELGPYGQGLAEYSENSDSQEIIVQGLESPAEAPSENMSVPEPAPSTSEPAPSTSIESTTRVSRVSDFDLQRWLQAFSNKIEENQKKQEENRQKDKKEQEERDKQTQQTLQEFQQENKADKNEIVEMLSQKLEQNQQILENKLEQNQQKLEEKQEQIREEIKVRNAENNKVKEKCDKEFELLLENAFSSKPDIETITTETEETIGKVEQEEDVVPEEKEDKLQRRLWESHAEVKPKISINKIRTEAGIVQEAAKKYKSAECLVGDDAIMEVDSDASVGPVEVSDVIPAPRESAITTPKGMQLCQYISLPTTTLASITLSKEMKLQLLAYEVQLKGISPPRDVCAKRNKLRFLRQIQQSPVLSFIRGRPVCDLPARDKLHAVSSLISPMLMKVTKSETTCALRTNNKQLHANTKTRRAAKQLIEKKEIAATQVMKWTKMKLQSELETATTTATSASRKNAYLEEEEIENHKGQTYQCWKHKSRHKLPVKKNKSRHKAKVPKLRERYCTMRELQIMFKRTKRVCLGSERLTFNLLAEHETHCVGPG
jgi:hypothetical protein